jgi:hypothetical protein
MTRLSLLSPISRRSLVWLTLLAGRWIGFL